MSISDTAFSEDILKKVETRGRPSLNVKPTQVRLSEEIREQIRELVGDNGMAQFIREAVEKELKRRERRA